MQSILYVYFACLCKYYADDNIHCFIKHSFSNVIDIKKSILTFSYQILEINSIDPFQYFFNYLYLKLSIRNYVFCEIILHFILFLLSIFRYVDLQTVQVFAIAK